MMGTRFSRCCFVFLVAIVFVLATAVQTWAGEKQKVQCKWVLKLVKSNEVKMPFDPSSRIPVRHDMLLALAEFDGMIFNEKGGSFLDKAQYQAYGMFDYVEGKQQGYEVFTMPNGSRIYTHYEGETGTEKGVGTFTFIGGTGEYEGVKGKGTYVTTYVTETLFWGTLEGEYELLK